MRSGDGSERPIRTAERCGWRPVRRVALILVLVYVGLVAVLYALQDSLIFPGAATQGRPEADVRPGPGAELVTLRTRDGQHVVALFGRALDEEGRPVDDPAARPTILYFYGNGMCLAAAVGEFEAFRRLGANVLIPDYLGYGLSGGRASEAGCYATADAALAHLRARPDVDPGRIVVAGWSLGAAVAADLAARAPVAGLALFSAFTSMTDLARRSVPFLPVGLLLRHRFDTAAKLGRVACPILIGHGRLDRLIPYSMSDRLAEAARGPVTRLTIDGADHNDFFRVGDRDIAEALGLFLARIGQAP